MESRAPPPRQGATTPRRTLQILNRLLQCPRDFLGIAFWRELHWLTDPHLNFPGRCKLLPGVLDFKQTINPHRKYGDAQIVGEQADSGAELAELRVLGVLSLGEEQHAVA